MWQSRCVSKTCRALLQVTDGERKSPPARRKKELSSTIKLDVSLLSQRFFFCFCFCLFFVFLDMVVLVNFVSAWGLFIWRDLRPETIPLSKGSRQEANKEEGRQKRSREPGSSTVSETGISEYSWLLYLHRSRAGASSDFPVSSLLSNLLLGHSVKTNASGTMVVVTSYKTVRLD